MSFFIKSATMKKDVIPFASGERFVFKPGINLLVGDQGCGKSTLLQMLMHYREYDVKVDPKFYNRSDGKSEYDYLQGKKIDKSLHIKEEFADAVAVESDMEQMNKSSVFFDTEHHNPRVLQGDNGSRGELAIIREFLNTMAPKMNESLVEELFKLAPLYADHVRGDAKAELVMLQSRLKSHGQVIFPMLKAISDNNNGLIFLDEPETSLSIRSQKKLVDVLYQALSQGCQLFIATHSTIIMECVEEVYSLEHKRWMPTAEFIKTQEKDVAA